MTRPRAYVFVLWGQDFEETPATIFVSELRRAGLQVKVVGLNMQRLTGVHGLSLVPDMTLDQALPLATQANCVIIPCRAKNFLRFSYDPRIAEFFLRLEKGNRTIVIGDVSAIDPDALSTMVPPDVRLIEYSDDEDLITVLAEIRCVLS